jgi:hypothetical protein
MKKAIAALLTAVLMVVPVSADPLARIETPSNGNAEVVGYDLVEKNGKEMLVILLNYENTTNESKAPGWNVSLKAFDNGIQLDHAYASGFGYDNDYYNSITEVRPGGVLPFYMLFNAPKSDNVEIELDELISFNSTPAVVTLDMNKLGISESESENEPADTVETDASAAEDTSESSSKTKKLKKRVSELEERVAALEERIAALENQ